MKLPLRQDKSIGRRNFLHVAAHIIPSSRGRNNVSFGQ